jgi:predicted NBD/HSP70 family sugar kinase
LGIAIAGALNLLDLGHVVLGGHLAELSSQLIPTVRAELDTRVLSAPFATPTVSVARPDAVAAAVGAAYAGLDRVVAEPASWAGD